MRMQIVVYDGFDELDALAPLEVLRRAAELGADLAVELVTLAPCNEVKASFGLRLRPDGVLDPDAPPDLLLVPGGGWNVGGQTGVRAEIARGELPATIAQLHTRGTLIATVCTGAMLAAAAGLTSGRHATTHAAALGALRESGADVPAVRVVDDGDLISAGGITSGLDLALWLVERFFGPKLACAIERRMEYERRGSVWRE
ncbi:MAG TPA: DJ-1/PfpI family protein [Ktedonobacterales bacterium]